MHSICGQKDMRQGEKQKLCADEEVVKELVSNFIICICFKIINGIIWGWVKIICL